MVCGVRFYLNIIFRLNFFYAAGIDYFGVNRLKQNKFKR